jgi:hypothetical protein
MLTVAARERRAHAFNGCSNGRGMREIKASESYQQQAEANRWVRQ